ncbi:hypothetical protein JRO89_XS04G0055900 [Xanthoceras sorbifolium]|uniref:Uncharacterized protein n=1 Tax=Xanthoceras sorbifolium TaxID=99658 RepID=A0ABQ8I484_9ROSI|nr:hypothetical protein JRO89_XS04G0055900 [Xanthoceras sorbifolium]
MVSKDGAQEVYSGCIMAVHAPDALKMLGSQVTFDEKRVLGAFQYANIDIFLHRDKKFMPQNRAVWSACNFVGNTDGKAYMTYWLNALQNIGETSLPFLVTLNPDHTPEHTLVKWSTALPLPSAAASKASLELHTIRGKRGIWFCGTCQAIINEKDEVLELWCGWRTLAIETVKRTGCKYTGINIVEEQLKYAAMKAKEAGLQVVFSRPGNVSAFSNPYEGFPSPY